MPYTNKFTTQMDDPNPAFRTMYLKILNEGVKNEINLTVALDILESASTGLRQAAAHGSVNDCLTILLAIKSLSAAVDKFQGKPTSHETEDRFLFKTSSNNHSALDWALKNSGPVQAEERGEYALCAAILLQVGFSEKNLQDVNKDPKKPLYGFIKEYAKYEAMHTLLNFNDAYENIMKMKGLHCVTSYYFMISHQKALTEYVTALKKEGVKEITVFEIGSSVPFELMALTRFFSSHEIKINYHGFDIKEVAIATAQVLFEPIKDHRLNFEVVRGEKLDKSEKYIHKADLVIIRHPDILGTETGPIFDDILKRVAPNLIKPSGLFLLSCYFPEEITRVAASLQQPVETFVKHESDFVLFGGGAVFGKTGADRPFVTDQFALSLTAPQLRHEQKVAEKLAGLKQ